MDDMRAVFIGVGFFAIVGILFHGWRGSSRTNTSNDTQDRQTPTARKTPALKGQASNKGTTAANKPQQEPHLGNVAPTGHARSDRQEPTLSYNKAERRSAEQIQSSADFVSFDQEDRAELEMTEDPVVAFEQSLSKVPEPQADIRLDEPHLEESQVPADPDDILVLHVVSKDKPIQGAELLHNLMASGLRFGEMDIFHMYKSSSGNGPVMFSLVDMMNPGTFNIDEMEQFSTRGVSLFMTLPCDGDARVHFSRMQGVAKGLADMHNAEVQDEHHKPWNDIKADAYLARIDKFEKSA